MDVVSHGYRYALAADTAGGLPHTDVVTKEKAPGNGIFLGTCNWFSGALTEKIFPPGISPAKYLYHYSSNYNTSQLDFTYYKNFSPADIQNWIREIDNPHFRFCPLLHNKATNFNRKAAKPIRELPFFANLHHYGKHLGPVVITIPERYSTGDIIALYEFVAQLPKANGYFLDLRHASWQRAGILPMLLPYLTQQGVGLVINDSHLKPKTDHPKPAIHQSYIRFTPSGDFSTDKQRLRDWHSQIIHWKSEGLTETYFIINDSSHQQVPLLQFMQELFHTP